MKKIFMLAVVFAAVSMVACGGNKEKKANAAEGEAEPVAITDGLTAEGEAAQTEVVDEQACCGECEGACEAECCEAEKECCGECCEAEAEAVEAEVVEAEVVEE